tara:strand:+ start:915 stop:1412 length:498 start_codon:yes stop_codon:yes gene_type:complete
MNRITVSENGLSKDFKTTVTKLEQDLISIADGENIIAGTKEKPIVSDSDKIPIRHFFMDGVYIREMTMFKGVAVIGAIHKDLHMCFLLKGHLTVADEDGTVDHIAPCHIIAKPGVKRVLYAHEDSVWYNTHKNPSNTKDVEKLEEELVATSYKKYNEYINKNNKI